MFFMELTIGNIDYCQSILKLLPDFIEKYKNEAGSNIIVRMVNRLGDKTVPVILNLMKFFDKQTTTALLAHLIDGHRDRLTGTINSYLDSTFQGPAVRLGGVFSAIDPDGQLILCASDVQVDYKSLVETEVVEAGIDRFGGEFMSDYGVDSTLLKKGVKFIIKKGARIAPNAMEKQVLQILSSEKTKLKIIPKLTEALNNRGLIVEISDLFFKPAEDHTIMINGEAHNANLPDMEDKILDAFAAWLITSVE